MYQFFLGLKKYLPAFTPEYTSEFLAQADSLADLERRQRQLERARRAALA